MDTGRREAANTANYLASGAGASYTVLHWSLETTEIYRVRTLIQELHAITFFFRLRWSGAWNYQKELFGDPADRSASVGRAE